MKKLKVTRNDNQITGNKGLFYACYRLSQLNWNVMTTTRNARGIDVIAYTSDATRYVGIQIKSLSKKSPVPLGQKLDVMGDYWVIVNDLATGTPSAFVLLPREIRKLAVCNQKEGKKFFWLNTRDYTKKKYKEAWDRIK